MRVIELAPANSLLARAFRAEVAKQPLRTGVHVGTICDDMLRQMDPKKYARYDRDTTEEVRHSWWALGNVVEDIAAEWMVRRYFGWEKPQPRTVRRITGSPDGWRPHSRTIDEVKVTWVSERDFLTSLKWVRYKMQGVSYAHMWGADRVCFHVFFVQGQGRPNFPFPRTFVVRPSVAEKQIQFEQLEQHAIDVGMLTAA